MTLRGPVIAMASLLVLYGCGGEDVGDAEAEEAGTIVETGSVTPDDTRDPMHSDLPYDSFRFEAGAGDVLTMEVSAEGFSPLLKLIEVDTGAVLAEWDAQYPTGEALSYRIALAGEYEGRVYSMDGGVGTYEVTTTLEP